ncbi:MAG TPA: hypothetical protein VI916_10025 [Acidimicrobiia bacterium]|nr:hypothetical protein [Acidimicrobiia bacterium]
MTSPSLRERARARNPLPEGAAVVGLGLGAAGITIYVFLAIAARTLGPDRYAALSTMWSITFLAAPGFYIPLEQEVGRALSDRRARGLGGGPVIKTAGVVAGVFVVSLTVAAIAGSGPLVNDFFDNEVLLLVGFLLALAGYAVQYLMRGALAASGRFGPYSFLLGAEGTLRMLACIGLAVAGVKTAGPYGLLIGVAAIVVIAAVAPRTRDLFEDGPEASWRELSRALGYLLVGSVLANAMINITPLIVTALASDDERSLVGKVLIALIISRVPLFLFQAVQASLIPQLAALAAQDLWAAFRSKLLRLLVAVSVLAALSTAGSWVFGPWVVRTFFGAEYELSGIDMAYLAAGSGLFMVALAMSQALIAIAGYRRSAGAWTVGMVTLLGVTAIHADLLFRVERGFVAGGVATIVVLAILLAEPLRRGHTVGEIEFTSPVLPEP